MRCETNHWRGFLVFEQIGDKTLERHLSLRERTLIEGCENFSGLDQGNQLLEEIGCDHLNLPQQTLLFKSLKHRNTVRSTDIQTLRFCIALKQSQGLSIRFLGTFMRFDCRKQAEMRSKHGKRGSEAAQLFGMIQSGQLPGDGSDMRFPIELVGQQLRRQGTTGICVRRYQTNALTARRITGDTKHRDSLLGQTMNDRIKLSWISRGKDDAVIPLLQPGLQQFRISLPEPRIFIEGDFYVQPDGRGCSGTYTGTQWVEKVRDLLRKNDRYFDSAVELQCLRSEVGLVSQLFGHLLNACLGLQADACTLVQDSIYRADRDTESFSDVFDASGFGCGLHRPQDSGMRRKIHAKAIAYRPYDFSVFRSRRAYRELPQQSILQARFVVRMGVHNRIGKCMRCDSSTRGIEGDHIRRV